MLGDKFRKFMYGRYGVDQFGKELLIFAVVVSLASMVISWFGIPIVTTVLSSLTTILMIYIIYRAFSKNINRRVMENNKYINLKTKAIAKVQFNVTRIKDAKNFKYVCCPKCKHYSRVPRGKGKIKITCRVCRNQFEKKV